MYYIKTRKINNVIIPDIYFSNTYIFVFKKEKNNLAYENKFKQNVVIYVLFMA